MMLALRMKAHTVSEEDRKLESSKWKALKATAKQNKFIIAKALLQGLWLMIEFRWTRQPGSVASKSQPKMQILLLQLV